jgi:O-antigen/teichoic acid export membrane protein
MVPMGNVEIAGEVDKSLRSTNATVARHTTLNLVGAVVPSIISLVTVPIYLGLIGSERFGVLSLAWLLLGYFGLFDLGLGAATSFRIAALRDGTAAARARTFWTALVVNLGLGVIGGGALWFAGTLFFSHVFKVDPQLRPEMLQGVPFLAASVPIATLTGVLYGSLQGRQQFFSTNLVSIISTVLFQAVPILVALKYGPHLPLLLGAAILARAVAMVVLMCMCYFELTRGYRVRVDFSEARKLMNYGAWVTVASIVGPVLVFADRFAIGAILGAVAVATYTVPFQLAQRINIIPGSLTNALFPKLVPATAAEHERLSRNATLTIASVLSFPVLIAILFLRPFLDIWIGPGMATQAASVGRILLIGFWINAFAYIPQMELQSSGRPRLVAQILVLQILPYLGALYLGMTYFGLTGCAVVFCVRNLADWLMLSWAARGSFRGWPILLLDLMLLVLTACLADISMDRSVQFAVVACAALISLVVSWRSLPAESRRLLLSGYWRVRGAVTRA